MFIAFFGAIVIGGIIGYVSEKYGFTQNGVIPSMIICIGGVILAFMVTVMFGFGFGSRGLNAIVASIGALIIVPTHNRPVAKGRYNRRRR